MQTTPSPHIGARTSSKRRELDKRNAGAIAGHLGGVSVNLKPISTKQQSNAVPWSGTKIANLGFSKCRLQQTSRENWKTAIVSKPNRVISKNPAPQDPLLAVALMSGPQTEGIWSASELKDLIQAACLNGFLKKESYTLELILTQVENYHRLLAKQSSNKPNPDTWKQLEKSLRGLQKSVKNLCDSERIPSFFESFANAIHHELQIIEELQTHPTIPNTLTLKDIISYRRQGFSPTHADTLKKHTFSPVTARKYLSSATPEEMDLLHQNGLGSGALLAYRRTNIPINQLTLAGTGKYQTPYIVGTPKPLKGGNSGASVQKVSFKNRAGFIEDRIFKTELEKADNITAASYAGIPMYNPRAGLRNLAAKKVSEILGESTLLPHVSYAFVNGEFGIVMAVAPGTSPLFHKQIDITDSILPGERKRILDMDLEERQQYAEQNQAAGLRLDGNGKIYLIYQYKIRVNPLDPVLLEQLTTLQYLDALCGEPDRNPTNYQIVLDRCGNVKSVMGIDTDQSFGKALHNPNDISYKERGQRGRGNRAFRSAQLPPFIGEKQYHALNNLDPHKLGLALKGLLTNEEIVAMQNRLYHIKLHLLDLRSNGRIISEGKWDGDTTKTWIKTTKDKSMRKAEPNDFNWLQGITHQVKSWFTSAGKPQPEKRKPREFYVTSENCYYYRDFVDMTAGMEEIDYFEAIGIIQKHENRPQFQQRLTSE